MLRWELNEEEGYNLAKDLADSRPRLKYTVNARSVISNRRPNQWAAGLSTVRRKPWITYPPLSPVTTFCRGGGQRHRRGTLDPHFRPHVAEVCRVPPAPPSPFIHDRRGDTMIAADDRRSDNGVRGFLSNRWIGSPVLSGKLTRIPSPLWRRL